MQEYILSFKNNQFNQKYEYLFKYNVKNIIDKYDFIYKRDGIIINIKLLKGLATISKVAKPFNTKYIDHSIKLYQKSYDTRIHNGIFFKLSKCLNAFPLININVSINKRLFYTKELFLYRPLDRHPIFMLYKKENIAFGCSNDLIQNPFNIYNNIMLTSDQLSRKSFSLYNNINIKPINNNLLSTYDSNKDFIEKHKGNYCFSIYNNDLIKKYKNNYYLKTYNNDLIKKYKNNYYLKTYNNDYYEYTKNIPTYQNNFYNNEFTYRTNINIKFPKYYITLSNLYTIIHINNFLGLNLFYNGKTKIFNTYLAKQVITNRTINLYEYNFLNDINNYYLNIFKNENFKKRTNILNIYKNFNISSSNYDHINNLYEIFTLFPYNNNKINLVSKILLQNNDINLQIENKLYNLQNNCINLIINNHQLLNQSNNNLYINSNYNLYKINNHIFHNNTFYNLNNFNNTLCIYNFNKTYKLYNHIFSNDTFYNLNTFNNTLYSYDSNKTYKLYNKFISFNTIDFGFKLNNYFKKQNIDLFKFRSKNINTYQNINIYRALKQIQSSTNVIGQIYSKNVNLFSNINMVRNLKVPITIYQQNLLLKTILNIYINDTNKNFLYKKQYNIYRNINDLILKSKYNIYRKDYYDFALKSNRYIDKQYKRALNNIFHKVSYNSLNTINKDTQIIKERSSTQYIQNNIIQIGNKIIPIMFKSLSISKINSKLYTEKNVNIIANKTRKINEDLNQNSVIKNVFNLNINLHLVYNKFAYNIILTKILNEFIIKNKVFATYYNHKNFINKYLYTANTINNFEKISKSKLYITPSELYGFTAIQKNLKEIIADNNIDWFIKPLSLYVDSDKLLSRIELKINNIFLSKHNFLRQIKNICIFPLADKLYKIQTITKTYIDNLYISKNIKKINNFKSEFFIVENILNLYKHVFLYNKNILNIHNYYNQLNNKHILNLYNNVYENIRTTNNIILDIFKSEWLKHINLNVYLQSRELQLFREKNIKLLKNSISLNKKFDLAIYNQRLPFETYNILHIIQNKNFLYKKQYNIYRNINNIFINKDIYTETNINDLILKSKYNIYRKDYYDFALKTNRYIYKQALNNTFTYKIPYNIYLTNIKDTQIIKERLSIKYIQDNIVWIGNKIIPVMLNSDNEHLILSINKINGELYTEKIINITNKARQIDGDLNQTSIIKDKLGLNIDLHLVCDKFAHNITLMKMLGEFIIKSQIFATYYNHENFINKYLYANVANNFEGIDRNSSYITSELYGFTAIQRILKKVIADNNIDWFNKSLGLYVNSDELLSKIGDIHLFKHNYFLKQIKDICIFPSADNLYKLQKITEAHININNIYAFKNIKKIDTFKDKFISNEKNLDLYKNISSSLEHTLKNVYENLYNNIYKSIYVTNNIILDIFKSEWLKHINLNVYLQSRELQLFREKNIKLSNFREEVNAQLNRESDLAVYNQGLSLETQNILHIIQNEHFLAKEDNILSVLPEHYLIDKDIILNKLPELEDIRRIIKEGNLMTDNLDFAWILEDDDPFNDPFKLDELLLPENDTRYEDFEDIIFNRETGKPRNTVKVIDSRHFIAKYPIHYPIKDRYDNNAYENIAKKYLVVKTDIMKEVFLAYYKIWQAHVFEFARMTMPQSAKKMLDYLYTWILITLPGERIPEALRVFRLIRWYLECGIIENSEYEIEYEASDLTSGKLNTTDIDIPCSLNTNFDEDHPIDPSMYIDTQLHIIRNNEHMLRDEAKFTMYINNDINTTITFYLNTESPIDIILNGNIIDHISIPTHGKMLYNIPYTEDINIFTIRKLAIDNNDPNFFIGNINISGIGNSGKLNISFNPTLQGNKLLNNVSQKTNAYFNLIYNNKDYLEQVVKNNLHLDDVYDKLKTYWNLHHQDKEKGKRWIIKET